MAFIGLSVAGQAIIVDVNSTFPLRRHTSGRYLIQNDGTPFLVHGDTPWMLTTQLTNPEITQYLENRAAKGFNAILIESPGWHFSSQDPHYENADGDNPFTDMVDVNFVMTAAHQSRLVHAVTESKRLGIAVFLNPAYLGFAGGEEGMMAEVTNASAGELQAYGVALADLLGYGNVVLCMGGDYAGDSTERNKQWNIVTGWRTIKPDTLVMAHGAPGGPGYDSWNGFTGWNLNTAYPGNVANVYSECDTEYARSGPIPFVMLEGRYEQENDADAADLRRQSYTAILSGACGQFFGNNPIWHFESPETLFAYSGTWQSNLDSTGSVQQQYVKALFDAYDWWLLQPKTDNSFVTTSLGSNDTRVVAALASDGSFGMVWTPDVTFTVNLAAFSISSIRARWYVTTDGTYAAIDTYSNSGTQSFNPPAERVLVLDEAP